MFAADTETSVWSIGSRRGAVQLADATTTEGDVAWVQHVLYYQQTPLGGELASSLHTGVSVGLDDICIEAVIQRLVGE